MEQEGNKEIARGGKCKEVWRAGVNVSSCFVIDAELIRQVERRGVKGLGRWVRTWFDLKVKEESNSCKSCLYKFCLRTVRYRVPGHVMLGLLFHCTAGTVRLAASTAAFISRCGSLAKQAGWAG